MPIRLRVPLPGPFVWYPGRRRKPPRPEFKINTPVRIVVTGVIALALGLVFAVNGAPLMLVAFLALWMWDVIKHA